MAKWTDKQTAIRALEKNGRVDPNALIAAARSKSHPCHDDFTWDISAAAQERWRDQARALIRQCKFAVMYEDEKIGVVEFIPSPEPDCTLFVSLPKLRSKPDTKAAMAAEIAMLAGLVSRIRGMAIAKQGILGRGVVSRLTAILSEVNALEEEFE